VLIFSLLIGGAGCSSVEEQNQKNSRAWIDKIALQTLHFRRPQGAGADPNAGPGGEDYQSKPLPGSNLDCEPADQLFRGLKLDEIRACLNRTESSTQDFILTYSVQKSIQPALVLKNEELKKGDSHRPACLDQLLKSIPVPREIYFQGVREGYPGELGCFASGLTPEAPPLIGFQLMPNRLELVVRIPPLRPLKTNQDVQLLLLSWVLRPFRDARRNQIEARVVPDRLCRLCIGEKNLVRADSIPPVPLWPNEEDNETTQSVRGNGTDVPLGLPNLPEQTGIN
jgi:hypothetical protein